MSSVHLSTTCPDGTIFSMTDSEVQKFLTWVVFQEAKYESSVSSQMAQHSDSIRDKSVAVLTSFNLQVSLLPLTIGFCVSVSRYGDMRVMMAYELFSMWQNLGRSFLLIVPFIYCIGK